MPYCTMIGLKNEFAMRYPFALLKNWNLQHANFDVLKLPVLEVCFYTPRSGCVAEVCTECVSINEINSGSFTSFLLLNTRPMNNIKIASKQKN